MDPGAASQQPTTAARWVGGALCTLAGGALFQFFGNSSRGYIDTASLFYWWGYQWTNPASETEHGWLVLGLSAWLGWRASRAERAERAENCGLRISDCGVRPAFGQGGLGNLEQSAEQRGTDTAAGGADLPPATTPNPKPQTPNRASAHASAALALVMALALHAAGFAAQQARISIVALLLFTWGVVRLAGGARAGRAAAFPLAFLVFAIPFNALDSVGFWLRVWVVDASAALARAAGIAVLQSGTQLVAPDGTYNYDVAAACSGIRSLTAIVALSVLAGYLNFRAWWRRGIVVLLCLPLVYLGNVARILAIVFAAEAGGPVWGDRAHEIMGYGIFAIVFGGMLAGISLLRRVAPEGEGSSEHRVAGSEQAADDGDRGTARGVAEILEAGSESADETSDARCRPAAAARIDIPDAAAGGAGSAPRHVVAIAAAVVALAGAEMAFLQHLRDSSPRGGAGVVLDAAGRDPVELPSFIGTEWIGRREEISAVEREVLPPDTGFSRKRYVSLSQPRRPVFLSIVLSGRDRTSIHRPELCLVGQGWTVVDQFAHRFSYPGRPDAAFPATVLRVRREVQTPRGKVVVPELTVYWFVNADSVAPTHRRMLLADGWNRLTRARIDRWAYVLMQTDASDGEPAALARMQAVLDGTLPVFQRPLPAR